MRGCLVELIWRLMVFAIIVIFRVIGFMLMLMVVSVSSLFVGVEEATNRIAFSWIQQATGNGIMIGYNPIAREALKLAAALMLVVGWLLTIATVWWIVSMVANR
jgi:hypothetical protein